ncbi:hypothetical protein ES703_68681 [subsurface metagenome]
MTWGVIGAIFAVLLVVVSLVVYAVSVWRKQRKRDKNKRG